MSSSFFSFITSLNLPSIESIFYILLNLSLEIISSVFLIIDIRTVVILISSFLLFSWWKGLHEEVRVLHHKHDKVWESVKYLDVFSKGYRPPFWVGIGSEFFSGSWHTVAHNIVRGVKQIPVVHYNRELVQLSDGGTVGLDWAVSSVDPKTSAVYKSPDLNDDTFPIVFLHHGLCGSGNSHYVLSAVNSFLKSQKYRVVCLVARGCGKVPLTTPQGFIAARTLDMREALEKIYARHPNSPVFGVGWSLGAGLMANYIGEEAESCRLSGAIIISPCWDFTCRSPWFKIWSSMFLANSLVEYTKANLEAFKKNSNIKLEQALSAKHVEEYDLNAVVPIHGFKDANEYYQKSSPLKVAHKICIPTLSLNSDDDPVCSVIGCPTKRKQMGPGLVIVRTYKGGHTSWASSFNGYDSWMDNVMQTWIDACYDYRHRTVIKRSIDVEKQKLVKRLSSRVRSDLALDKLSLNESVGEDNKLPTDKPKDPVRRNSLISFDTSMRGVKQVVQTTPPLLDQVNLKHIEEREDKEDVLSKIIIVASGLTSIYLTFRVLTNIRK